MIGMWLTATFSMLPNIADTDIVWWLAVELIKKLLLTFRLTLIA